MPEPSARSTEGITSEDGAGEGASPTDSVSGQRKQWVAPALTKLPPLKDLTLQTGMPIGGGESVFP